MLTSSFTLSAMLKYSVSNKQFIIIVKHIAHLLTYVRFGAWVLLIPFFVFSSLILYNKQNAPGNYSIYAPDSQGRLLLLLAFNLAYLIVIH